MKTLALRTCAGVAAAWATSMLLAGRGRPWLAIGTGALVIVAFVAVAERGRVAQLLRPSASHLGRGLAAGALMIAVTYLVYPLACLAFPSMEAPVGPGLRPPRFRQGVGQGRGTDGTARVVTLRGGRSVADPP